MTEEIEFEGHIERKFELLMGYPPVKMESDGQRIGDAMQEDRENIVIREW